MRKSRRSKVYVFILMTCLFFALQTVAAQEQTEDITIIVVDDFAGDSLTNHNAENASGPNCAIGWGNFAFSYQLFGPSGAASGMTHGNLIVEEFLAMGVDQSHLIPIEIGDGDTRTIATELSNVLSNLGSAPVVINFSNGIVPCETVSTFADYNAQLAQSGGENNSIRFNLMRSLESATFASYIGTDTDDIRIRRAIAQAVDIESLVEGSGIFPSEAVFANQFIPRFIAGVADTSLTAYNPELSMQLLDEAGVVDSNGDDLREPPLNIYYSANLPSKAIDFIGAQLRQVGIEANFEQKEAWAYLNEFYPDYRWWAFESLANFNQQVQDNLILIPIADTLMNDRIRTVLQDYGARVFPVGAAGNSGLNFPFYPAAWPEVVSVTAFKEKIDDFTVIKDSRLNSAEVALPGTSLSLNGGSDNYTSFAAPRLSFVASRYLGGGGSITCSGSNATTSPPLAHSFLSGVPVFDNLALPAAAIRYCQSFPPVVP